MPEPLIPPHGGYRRLVSFQVAQLVYDLTVRFCERYIDRRSRTHDQMVQAARSGVQNIAEGSRASGTSKKTELKLTNVARASLEELRLDFQDFLRQRALSEWKREDQRREELVRLRPASVNEIADWAGKTKARCGTSPEESAANPALTLIAVASALLDRQLRAQAESFSRDGGFTERLYRTRKAARNSQG